MIVKRTLLFLKAASFDAFAEAYYQTGIVLVSLTVNNGYLHGVLSDTAPEGVSESKLVAVNQSSDDPTQALNAALIEGENNGHDLDLINIVYFNDLIIYHFNIMPISSN